MQRRAGAGHHLDHPLKVALVAGDALVVLLHQLAALVRHVRNLGNARLPPARGPRRQPAAAAAATAAATLPLRYRGRLLERREFAGNSAARRHGVAAAPLHERVKHVESKLLRDTSGHARASSARSGTARRVR
jgi:hypothetical protein